MQESERLVRSAVMVARTQHDDQEEEEKSMMKIMKRKRMMMVTSIDGQKRRFRDGRRDGCKCPVRIRKTFCSCPP